MASAVASVPYDTVETEEARAVITCKPYNFLRVVRPEADLPPGTDIYSDAVYQRAAANFRAFQEDGILVREHAACLYVYRQVMAGHVQRGIMACCHVDDYASGVIKRHERTREKKEADRARHVATLRANTGPVFLTYRDNAEIDEKVAAVERSAPLFDFTSHFGIRHTVWRVTESDGLAQAFLSVPGCYIADGHHRAAAAARAAAGQRDADSGQGGEGEFNWFMCCLLPASQLQVLAYNRWVSDLNGLTAADFLARVKERFHVLDNGSPEPAAAHQVSLYMAGTWRTLSWDTRPAIDRGLSLDVAYLQDRLLAPILGIADPMTDDRIDFVGGLRGAEEIRSMVDSGRAAAAFSMYPVTVDQMMGVADAGDIMPPKSTWFEPKLKSGLLVHTW